MSLPTITERISLYKLKDTLLFFIVLSLKISPATFAPAVAGQTVTVSESSISFLFTTKVRLSFATLVLKPIFKDSETLEKLKIYNYKGVTSL